jgi:hypothetical protein
MVKSRTLTRRTLNNLIEQLELIANHNANFKPLTGPPLWPYGVRHLICQSTQHSAYSRF